MPYRLITIPRVTIMENLVKVRGITSDGINVKEAEPRIGYNIRTNQPEYFGKANPINIANNKPSIENIRINNLYHYLFCT